MEPIKPNETINITTEENDVGTRIDVLLSQRLSLYSRTFFQKLITKKCVKINGKIATKSKTLIKENDEISITFPENKTVSPKKIIDTDLGVEIIHEHPDFFIINKPAGLVVHKPSDTKYGESIITLADWMLSKFSELQSVGESDRPGIVHRLDKNTSGIMIIPRKNHVHAIFGDLFRNRKIQKKYVAVVQDHPDKEGTIDFPIARHPKIKIKMTHDVPSGKQSKTNYKVLEYFKDSTLVEAKPITGRTHQIRVHFAAIGHSLIGDTTYGKKSKLINRHALHAQEISFPYKEKDYSFSCKPPEDFSKLTEVLRKNS